MKMLVTRAQLPYELKWAWQDLVKVATGKGTQSDREFARLVERIRHSAAFHYYEPKQLVAG